MESHSTEGLPISQRIDESLPLIFDFSFPIYDENHRADLERKIILHYFNREIGLETYGLWKLYLEERLNLEMPYYNQLYETEARKYDYLINIDEHIDSTGKVNTIGTNDRTKNGNSNRVIKDSGTDKVTHSISEQMDGTIDQNSSGKTTDEGNTSGKSTTISSDFPQATFNKNTDYASGSQQNETSGTSGGTSNTTNHTTTTSNDKKTGTDIDTTEYGKTINDTLTTTDTDKDVENRNEDRTSNQYSYGVRGSRAQLVQEYRATILNIDKMVVEMLGDLFMGVY